MVLRVLTPFTELTHDAIYKAKKKIKPVIHRTVAKSMALIETTDEFFEITSEQLNNEAFDKFNVREHLDDTFNGFVGLEPSFLKSSIIIWDAYEQLIDENLVGNIQDLLNNNRFLAERVKFHCTQSTFYQQSITLFLYWLLKKRRNILLRNWPFERELLLPLANDLGISTLD